MLNAPHTHVIGHICLICETVPSGATVVSNEFYLCPKCKKFFREYMLARMQEKDSNSHGIMKYHD